MSIKVSIRHSNKAIRELLKGIINHLEESNPKQRLDFNISIRFVEDDC